MDFNEELYEIKKREKDYKNYQIKLSTQLSWKRRHQFKFIRKIIKGKYVRHTVGDMTGPEIWFKVESFEKHERERLPVLKGSGLREEWK